MGLSADRDGGIWQHPHVSPRPRRGGARTPREGTCVTKSARAVQVESRRVESDRMGSRPVGPLGEIQKSALRAQLPLASLPSAHGRAPFRRASTSRNGRPISRPARASLHLAQDALFFASPSSTHAFNRPIDQISPGKLDCPDVLHIHHSARRFQRSQKLASPGM